MAKQIIKYPIYFTGESIYYICIPSSACTVKMHSNSF